MTWFEGEIANDLVLSEVGGGKMNVDDGRARSWRTLTALTEAWASFVAAVFS